MDTFRTDQPYDVLAVGAHPDDVEMGMGGTVASLTAAGRRVAILDLTAGELGTYGDAETRRAEAEVAAGILGADLRILDFPDGGVVDDLEGRHRLVRILREVRPTVVFAPYPHARGGAWDGRTNVDHLATGSMVDAAVKLARFRSLMPDLEPHGVRKVFHYMVPDDLKPSLVVDVTPFRDTLTACIEAYGSQLEITRGDRSVQDILMVHRQLAGHRIHVELGEAFHCEDVLTADAAWMLEA